MQWNRNQRLRLNKDQRLSGKLHPKILPTNRRRDSLHHNFPPKTQRPSSHRSPDDFSALDDLSGEQQQQKRNQTPHSTTPSFRATCSDPGSTPTGLEEAILPEAFPPSTRD
jgi:hypothetical protein